MFFNRNSVFLSQQIGRNSVRIVFFSEANGANDNVTSYEDDFNLLLWWRDHKLTFPILSIMARDIISVPVSTVSSESCFSLIGRIIEERRWRLSPETGDADLLKGLGVRRKKGTTCY